MIVNSNFVYETSLSLDAYENKEISGAMIGSGKVKENREIRKKYGFDARYGIGYIRTSTTPQEHLEKMISGHVMCNLFNPAQTRADGTFGASQKKDDNFDGSWTIAVDIDETNYTSPEEFVSTLSHKPTFWYTSYSNCQKGKGVRFRMIYVFSEKITNPYFFRYCAYQVHNSVEMCTGEEIKDYCGCRCSQYMNGTNKNATGIICGYDISNNIYDFSDFNISLEGFRDFLIDNCKYKSPSSDTKKIFASYVLRINTLFGINESINNINTILNTTNISNQEKKDTTGSDYVEINVVFKPEVCSKELVSDMKNQDYKTFVHYNSHKFEYFWRKDNGIWEKDAYGNEYQKVDSDYFSLFFNANMVMDGNKRRKELYQRMCLRRIIKPSVSADELLYNAYLDLRFYQSDKDLTIDCLVSNVNSAMSREIEDLKEEFFGTIEYLKSLAPSKRIIFKNTGKHSKEVLSQTMETLVLENYDFSKSVKENLEYINENVVKVSKSFVYNLLKEKGEKTLGKATDDELLAIINSDLSVRKNLEIIKDKGYKCSKDRISKLLNSINNISNNITSNNNIIDNSTNTNTTNISNMEKKDSLEISFDFPKFDITLPDFLKYA